MDRNLSMTFGRPPSIPEAYVKLQPPSAFHPTYGAALGIPGHPQDFKSLGVNFFNATIELYKTLSKVLELMYGQNLGCGENESMATLLSRFTTSYLLLP